VAASLAELATALAPLSSLLDAAAALSLLVVAVGLVGATAKGTTTLPRWSVSRPGDDAGVAAVEGSRALGRHVGVPVVDLRHRRLPGGLCSQEQEPGAAGGGFVKWT
jgi:hypothetical protein